MTKAEKNAWKLTAFAMLALFVFGLMAACGKRPTQSTESVEIDRSKEKTEVTKTTNTETQVNGAINDKTVIAVPPPQTGDKNCDSLCDLALQRQFEQFNREIQSGQNSYKVWYDKHNRQLHINAQLAETINRLKESSRDSIHVKERHFIKTVKTSVTITERYIPKWVKWLAWLGAAFVVLIILLLIKRTRQWLLINLYSLLGV